MSYRTILLHTCMHEPHRPVLRVVRPSQELADLVLELIPERRVAADATPSFRGIRIKNQEPRIKNQ